MNQTSPDTTRPPNTPVTAAGPFLDNRPGDAGEQRFLGMTALQRFILMLLIFVLTLILGSLTLLVAGKLVLPLY